MHDEDETELDLDLDLDDLDLDLDDEDLEVDLDEETEEALDETAAADTIKAKPSRTATVASIVQGLASLSHEDLNKFAASIAKPSNPIPDGTSEKNKATIAAKKLTSEDLNELFGEDLTEDFKNKANVLFEAAVNLKVSQEVAEISENLEAAYAETVEALEEAHVKTLEEEVESLTNELYENADKYLTHAVEEFLEENSLAITKSLRSELAEDFMFKMKDLFLEHNLNIEDDSEDVVEELVSVNEELEEELNEANRRIIELSRSRLEEDVDNTLNEETSGLASSTKDKIYKLVENLDYSNLEEFKAKLSIIKEGITNKGPSSKTGIIQEEISVTEEELEQEAKPRNSARMEQYIATAVKATSKN